MNTPYGPSKNNLLNYISSIYNSLNNAIDVWVDQLFRSSYRFWVPLPFVPCVDPAPGTGLLVLSEHTVCFSRCAPPLSPPWPATPLPHLVLPRGEEPRCVHFYTSLRSLQCSLRAMVVALSYRWGRHRKVTSSPDVAQLKGASMGVRGLKLHDAGQQLRPPIQFLSWNSPFPMNPCIAVPAVRPLPHWSPKAIAVSTHCCVSWLFGDPVLTCTVKGLGMW